MNILDLASYGKINLSLDIQGVYDDGYHKVSTIMQQIRLHDRVAVRFTKGRENRILVKTNKPFIPTDGRNIAYKAVELMREYCPQAPLGEVRVDIKKNIPVGAGLAGGSGNGGAVLLALNHLWRTRLSLQEICVLGGKLGADVAFSIRAMAYSNDKLGFREDPFACSCVLAEGKGDEITKVNPLKAFVVLSKPPVSISTEKAYGEIDRIMASQKNIKHPDNRELIRGLESENWDIIRRNMINILELFAAKGYDDIMYTKNKMKKESSDNPVLMSGSGSSIYALFKNKADGERVYRVMKKVNRETFLTKTTV